MDYSYLFTLTSFLFFTGMVGFVTWRMTRHDRHDTSDGYFLGGRSLTAGFIAGSLMLTNLSTEQLVGLNGDAFTDGLCVMAWEVVSGISLVVMALVFLPRYLRSGITTVPQFLEQRFDSLTRGLTSILFIIAYAGILLPIILYTGATGLNGILDVQQMTGIESQTALLWMTVWLVGVVGSIYAIFGGLRTVAVSDTINGIGLLIGGVLIAYLGLRAIDANPLTALQTLQETHSDKFNSLGRSDQSVPFWTLFTGVPLLTSFYWCTNQQIIQRTFAASTLREGQKGVLLAALLKVLAPLILVLPGIIAFHLYSQEGINKGEAYGTLVRNVLPGPLAGFFAAVIVGAILSSFNSALNSTATLFSLGVYQHILHPKATDEQVIRAGKRFAWVIAVVAMTGAPFLASQESIFGYLQKMNGMYAVPIFAVVVTGLAWRRVPALAANVALIFGFAAIVLGYFVPPFSVWAGTINGFHFLGVVFASLIAIMLGITLIRPRSEPWKQADSKRIEMTPWPWAWPVGIGLVLLVLGLYAAFADLSALGAKTP